MTWQNKYVISLLPQGRLLPQNLVGCWNKITNFLPSYFRSLDNVVLQDHVTNSVHYISTTTLIMTIKLGRAMRLYGASTHKVTQRSKNVIKWGHVTDQMIYSTTTKPLAIEHGKMVTSCHGLPPMKSHNPLNTWSFQVIWYIKNVIYEELPAINTHECLSKWFCEVMW